MAEPINLLQMLECVDRELGFRVKVYPRWVSKHPPKMTPQTMNRELDRMRAVRHRLLEAAALDVVVADLAKRAGVPMGELVSRLEQEVNVLAGVYPKCP